MLSVRLKEENENYLREVMKIEHRSANYVTNAIYDDFRIRNPIVNGKLQLNRGVGAENFNFELILGDQKVGQISIDEEGVLTVKIDQKQLLNSES